MNLPVLPTSTGIDIITSKTTIPQIIRHLDPHVFQRDEEVTKKEVQRYTSLDNLTADQKGVLNAHKALEEGRSLIDISRVMRETDYRNEWPLLGVGRITDKVVYCCRFETGRVDFLRKTGWRGKEEIFFSLEKMPPNGLGVSRLGVSTWVQRQSAVPALPPELATKYDPNADDLRILWEATWTNETREPPPRPHFDPALIQHVAGSLYAVIAVWDLSPVEIAVLGPKVG